MKRYAKGRRFEYLVRDRLKRDGWFIARVAGSRGVTDLIGIKPSDKVPHSPEVILVQCSSRRKPYGQIRPLLDLCNRLNVDPVLAIKWWKGVPLILRGEGAINNFYPKIDRKPRQLVSFSRCVRRAMKNG